MTHRRRGSVSKRSTLRSIGVFIGGVVSVVCVALSLHLLLSYFNFVPSEVRSANQEIIQSLYGINTISYKQPVARRTALPVVNESVANESVSGTTPLRVEIPKIDVDAEIYSPDSVEIAVLDEALTKGVVHYPGSGLLGQDRTVFLFGHSSSLSFVRNKAYEAFNGLGELSVDDKIFVTGAGDDNSDEVYVYTVRSVRLAEADDALVEFESGAPRLVLSTCNSFGKKTERIVVEATLERVE